MLVQSKGRWFVKSQDGAKTLCDPEGYDSEERATRAAQEVEHFAKKDGAELLEVHRLDRGELKKPERLANGWVRADAYLTRTGVFTYRNTDGSQRREYRPPSEVFKADALQTFALAPLTDEHPPSYLDANNTREYARGAVSEPRRDGSHVRATLLVTDADLVSKLDDGKARQVSCGYRCQLEMTSGTTPDGERFDAIQRNIVGNHVAIVPMGRAGASASVRMDAADLAVLCLESDGGKDPAPNFPTSKEDHMKNTIMIAGVAFEVESAQTAQAFAKFDADQKAAIEALKKEIETAKAGTSTLQGKLDAEVEAHGKTKEELKTLPEKVRADAKARLQLEAKARAVLGEKAKLDALKDTEIRVKVLEKLAPKLDAEGKDAAYLTARFDAALEAFEANEGEERPVDRLRADADEVEGDDEREDGEEPAERADSQSAYERMVKRNQKAAQKKTNAEA